MQEAQLEQSGILIRDAPIKDDAAGCSITCSITCCCSHDEMLRHDKYISYLDLLWCQKVDYESMDNSSVICELTYFDRHGPQKLKTDVFMFESSANERIVDTILSKAYPKSKLSPNVLVLVNPHSGLGKAVRTYYKSVFPVLKAAHANVTYIETQYSGEAVEIAKLLDINAFDVIACCSGDGIPHEVINGFFQRNDKAAAFEKIAVAQLPSGSGNAMALSTFGTNNASLASMLLLKSKRTKLDLMAVTQGVGATETTKLSFLSQCFGLIADADIGTEHLRWLGPVRFELGVFQKLISKAAYPCDLYVNYAIDNNDGLKSHVSSYLKGYETDDKIDVDNFKLKIPPLDSPPPSDWKKVPDSSSINLVYACKMPVVSSDTPFFPYALPNDGLIDLIVTGSKVSLIESLSMMTKVEKAKHVQSSAVHYSKVSGYRLIPKLKEKNHYISVDGESFPVEPLQVEVLPGVLTGLLFDGNFVGVNDLVL